MAVGQPFLLLYQDRRFIHITLVINSIDLQYNLGKSTLILC